MKVIEQFFHLVLFIMLYNKVLTLLTLKYAEETIHAIRYIWTDLSSEVVLVDAVSQWNVKALQTAVRIIFI